MERPQISYYTTPVLNGQMAAALDFFDMLGWREYERAEGRVSRFRYVSPKDLLPYLVLWELPELQASGLDHVGASIPYVRVGLEVDDPVTTAQTIVAWAHDRNQRGGWRHTDDGGGVVVALPDVFMIAFELRPPMVFVPAPA